MPIRRELVAMVLSLMALCLATPAFAQHAEDLLSRAAFQSVSKSAALADVKAGLAATKRRLASAPRDRDAMLQHGIALGYRARLTRSPSDAKASRSVFQQLAASDPNDARAQMALAFWNLDAVDDLGGFLARTLLGAKRDAGEQALARAVRLGAADPFLQGMAAMVTIREDPSAIAAARTLAERAVRLPAETSLDRMIQQGLKPVIAALRSGDGKQAANLARKRLPFGMMKT